MTSWRRRSGPRRTTVDESGEFNWEAARKGATLGLLGLSIPEEYGGAGVDSLGAALAIEELGWGCGSTALSLAAHNGLGTAPDRGLRIRTPQATVVACCLQRQRAVGHRWP